MTRQWLPPSSGRPASCATRDRSVVEPRLSRFASLLRISVGFHLPNLTILNRLDLGYSAFSGPTTPFAQAWKGTRTNILSPTSRLSSSRREQRFLEKYSSRYKAQPAPNAVETQPFWQRAQVTHIFIKIPPMEWLMATLGAYRLLAENGRLTRNDIVSSRGNLCTPVLSQK